MLRRPTSLITGTTLAITTVLGAGLWFGWVFLTSSADWTARDRGWTKLEHRIATGGISEAISVGDSGDAFLFSVDDAGRVTVLTGSAPHTASRKLLWKPNATASPQSILKRGLLTTGEAAFPAVVRDTSSANRRTGVCLAVDLATTESQVIREQLGLMLAAVGAWVAALQIGIGCFAASRIREQREAAQALLTSQAQKQERELTRTRNAVIFGLAKLAESRDPDTGLHLERITQFSKRLALALGRRPCYGSRITPEFIRLIEFSASLHDIGKVGVEDAILLKPGRLTNSERERMQIHPVVGGNCLYEVERRLGGSNFLKMAREIALYHHERWDGTGYPSRLAGEAIPLAARIVAIADVYDALSSERVYKEAHSHETCVWMIREEAGQHFDPEIVEAFLSIEQEFEEIARAYADETLASRPSEASVGPQVHLTPTRMPAAITELLNTLADPDAAALEPPAASERRDGTETRPAAHTRDNADTVSQTNTETSRHESEEPQAPETQATAAPHF